MAALRYAMMAELKVFAEGLGMGCGRKEGMKDDSKVK